MPELGRQGPAIFKTPDARTAFHSASRREERDTLRRRLREDLGPYFSASSSSPKRLEANGEMYISHESRHITLVDKAMSDCPQIVTRTGEGGWVVVVSIEELMRVERRNGNLVLRQFAAA